MTAKTEHHAAEKQVPGIIARSLFLYSAEPQFQPKSQFFFLLYFRENNDIIIKKQEDKTMDMNELGYFIYMDTMEKQQREQQNSLFGDAEEDGEDDE